MRRHRAPAFTAIMLSASLAPAFAAPIAATSPDGGCGKGLTWITIPDLLAWRPLFPPPYAAAIDSNANAALCYLSLPAEMSSSSPEFGHLIVVDDRGPSR
jgi:hypothetical protein